MSETDPLVETDLKKEVPETLPDLDTLSKSEVQEEAEQLREAIRHHDRLYYEKNRPAISDAAYDRLFGRLQEIEEAFPELRTEDSPTRRVGSPPVDRLERVEHRAPMLSLDAVLEAEDMRDFDRFVRDQAGERVRYVLEPKFDGFSVEIVYRDGVFEHGSTRGDGEVGEDISRNLQTIRAVPLRLESPDEAPTLLAIRGEVLLRKSGFQELNKRRIEAGKEPFANPRNAAAGMMRQLDSGKLVGLPFDVVFYELLAAEGDTAKTHEELLEALSDQGLVTDPHRETTTDPADIERFHQRMLDERESFEVEIDGVVIKLDDLALREQLGTRHRSPRWALAWKFPPRKEVTRLADIVVQVGRTGVLTHVALLDPVDVGGVTVSRATLHNEEDLERKDVRVGDRVRIERAGDVIPEVVERVKQPGRKRSRPFEMPDRCPSCGGPVERQGAYHVCTAGLACPAQLVGRILHYASREALDITGLGEETARQLVERGWVEDMADLYTLDVDRLKELEGFADRSARQLHEAIQKARAPRLDHFIHGLGVPHVGRRMADLLARRFEGIGELVEASAEDLAAIEGIGPEVARAIAHFFQDPTNRDVLQRLSDAGVEPQPVRGGRSRALEGKTFVFTGQLEGFTRKEAESAVESRGGRATSSVSGETDYLVVGSSPGSKLDEAREHDIRRLDESEFEEILESA